MGLNGLRGPSRKTVVQVLTLCYIRTFGDYHSPTPTLKRTRVRASV